MANVFPSITELIPNLKHGDEQAWASLFDKFRVGLTSKCRFLTGTSQVQNELTPDDLVQETFLKAWRKHESFSGNTTSQMAHWLLVIRRNTYADWYRSKPKGKKTVSLDSGAWFEFAANDDSPSAIVINVETEAALLACMAELKTQQQEVIALKHFEGLTFQEISNKTQINANTVAGIYRRGLKRLMEQMGNMI